MKNIFLFVSICTLFSCESEPLEVNPSTIVGIWGRTAPMEDPGLMQSFRYHFKSDNSFEAVLIVQDKDSKQVLGYQFKRNGTYFVDNGLITLNSEEIFKNDDSAVSYSDLEDLERDIEVSSISVDVYFEENGAVLVFDYAPCPPNVNCIDYVKYNKLNFY